MNRVLNRDNVTEMAAIGTLAAGIAHEINNPLWMIGLQVDTARLAAEKGDEGELDKSLSNIRTLVDRCSLIVQNVLQFFMANPVYLVPVLAVVAMLVYSLLKKLIKLAAIVAIAGGLYLLMLRYLGM